MTKRWVGVHVAGEKVTLVDASVPDDDGPIEIVADKTFTLQAGERPKAYKIMHDRLSGYVREHKIAVAIVKESALPLRGAPKLALLHAAELRGVTMSALASVCETKSVARAAISRKFGARNVDEYLKDNGFWTDEANGIDLRAGSREAAMQIIASRKTKKKAK